MRRRGCAEGGRGAASGGSTERGLAAFVGDPVHDRVLIGERGEQLSAAVTGEDTRLLLLLKLFWNILLVFGLAALISPINVSMRMSEDMPALDMRRLPKGSRNDFESSSSPL